jgi:hypothetical protein
VHRAVVRFWTRHHRVYLLQKVTNGSFFKQIPPVFRFCCFKMARTKRNHAAAAAEPVEEVQQQHTSSVEEAPIEPAPVAAAPAAAAAAAHATEAAHATTPARQLVEKAVDTVEKAAAQVLSEQQIAALQGGAAQLQEKTLEAAAKVLTEEQRAALVHGAVQLQEKTLDMADAAIERVQGAVAQVDGKVHAVKAQVDETVATVKNAAAAKLGEAKAQAEAVKTQVDEKVHAVKTQVDEKVHAVKTQVDEKVHAVKTQVDEKVAAAKGIATAKLGEAKAQVEAALDGRTIAGVPVLETLQSAPQRVERVRADARVRASSLQARAERLVSSVNRYRVESTALVRGKAADAAAATQQRAVAACIAVIVFAYAAVLGAWARVPEPRRTQVATRAAAAKESTLVARAIAAAPALAEKVLAAARAADARLAGGRVEPMVQSVVDGVKTEAALLAQ